MYICVYVQSILKIKIKILITKKKSVSIEINQLWPQTYCRGDSKV